METLDTSIDAAEEHIVLQTEQHHICRSIRIMGGPREVRRNSQLFSEFSAIRVVFNRRSTLQLTIVSRAYSILQVKLPSADPSACSSTFNL